MSTKDTIRDRYPDTFWIMEAAEHAMFSVPERFDEAIEASKDPEIRCLTMAVVAVQAMLTDKAAGIELKDRDKTAMQATTLSLALFFKDYLAKIREVKQ